MNEITKLYKNAGVEKFCSTYKTNKQCEGIIDCSECASAEYPPFTSEKQIELIKWLKDNRDFHTCGNWCTALDSTGETVEHRDSKFEEALAGLINQLFIAQDLTEEEKQQVKGILE